MIEKIVAAFLSGTGILLCTGCVGVISGQAEILTLPVGDPVRKDQQVSVQVDEVVDTLSGDTLSPQALAQRLTDGRLILIAEQHTDLEYHRVQLRVLELLQQTGRAMVIGLEMFEVEDQPLLDAWVAGRFTEAEFLDESDWYGNWGYHWGYYRDILLFARAHAIPLVALNAPRNAVTGMGADDATADGEAHGAALPLKVDLSSPDHRALFRAFFDTDDPIHGGLPEDQWEALFAAQCSMDAVMAANAALALDSYPDTALVALAGTGHVIYELGIARQIKDRYAGSVTTIVPVAVADADTRVQSSIGDFVWGIPDMPAPAFPELGALSVGVEAGLHIIHVEPDSPAEAGGLETGDILTSFKGVTIESRPDLNRILATIQWGDEVAVTVEREEEQHDLTLRFQR